MKIEKRIFDIILSIVGILLVGWLIVLLFIISAIDTKSCGLYFQKRIGYKGCEFLIFKLKTMRSSININTTITTSNDPRLTKIGKFLRKSKLDELPQLFNILLGDMSFVGPRPDVVGFADKLEGDDRIILSVRPGLTGPASIYYKNEEELLAEKENPEEYNRKVIWPKKIAINKNYIYNYSFLTDIKILLKTVFNV